MSAQYQRERKNAEAVVAVAFRNFGTHAFRVDPQGDNAKALKLAEKRGWCWWPGDDRCALTAAGIEQASAHLGGA